MKCCICGCEIEHSYIKNYFGNNPWPISINDEDRCCDNCNEIYVIPARIELVMSESEKEK